METHLARVLIPSNYRETGGPADPLPGFTRGEVLRAKVLAGSLDGSARLLLKGKSVLVKTPFHFRPGMEVHLKVEQALPSPVLRCMGEVPVTGALPGLATLFSALKENVWETLLNRFGPAKRLPAPQSDLATHIRTLSSGVYAEGAAGALKKIIDAGGFTWESKLARLLSGGRFSKTDIERLISNDLKGLAARALLNPKEADADVGKLLTTIDQVQLLNRPDAGSDRRLFFPIPMAFGDGYFSVAQLLLQFPKQRECADPKPHRADRGLDVFLLVELSFLGPVRAELCLRGKRVDGRFLLIRPEARDLVRAGLSTLREALEHNGFSIGHIQCLLAEAETVQRPLVGEMIPARENALCLIA